MLMAGIATFVFGICTTVITSMDARVTQGLPARAKANKPKMLSPSIWAIGVGIVLAIIGSLLCGTYAKDIVTNAAGFVLLLTGICISVRGAFGTALLILKIELDQNKKQLGIEVDKPRILFFSILTMVLESFFS
jgi:hypothetical protein